MNTAEIRQGIADGTMTPDQAREAFMALRQSQGRESQAVVLPSTPPTRNLPAKGQLNIADIHAKDRASLAKIRSDLALQIENRSARHEYQRQFVEESARHAIALPAVALLGIADGALEGLGYGISELLETFTYTATRTIRRMKEGFERGRTQ